MLSMGTMKIFKSYMYHEKHKFTKTMHSAAIGGASLVYKKPANKGLRYVTLGYHLWPCTHITCVSIIQTNLKELENPLKWQHELTAKNLLLLLWGTVYCGLICEEHISNTMVQI